MILLGSGALLARSVGYVRRVGLTVDVVCCPPRDYASFVAAELGMRVLETNNPSDDLLSVLSESTDRTAFSINNRHILEDHILSAGVSFFNIHSGLIQQYRGLADVCIFAALCKGERFYGVTLHRILPKQRVDSGPVVSQLQFDVAEKDGFSDVLTTCMRICQSLFEENVGRVLSGDVKSVAVDVSHEAYSYKHVAQLSSEADVSRLSRATDFGPYASAFPKLKAIAESACIRARAGSS